MVKRRSPRLSPIVRYENKAHNEIVTTRMDTMQQSVKDQRRRRMNGDWARHLTPSIDGAVPYPVKKMLIGYVTYSPTHTMVQGLRLY